MIVSGLVIMLALFWLADVAAQALTPSASPLPAACSAYTVMNDYTREVGYSNVYLCDADLPTAWYRFEDGNYQYLPESAPLEGSCGTDAPGWLDGSHPLVTGSQAFASVCFSYAGFSCYTSLTISVINCGAYFIYHLVALNCDAYGYGYYDVKLRYCTTSTLPRGFVLTSSPSSTAWSTSSSSSATSSIATALWTPSQSMSASASRQSISPSLSVSASLSGPATPAATPSASRPPASPTQTPTQSTIPLPSSGTATLVLLVQWGSSPSGTHAGVTASLGSEFAMGIAQTLGVANAAVTYLYYVYVGTGAVRRRMLQAGDTSAELFITVQLGEPSVLNVYPHAASNPAGTQLARQGSISIAMRVCAAGSNTSATPLCTAMAAWDSATLLPIVFPSASHVPPPPPSPAGAIAGTLTCICLLLVVAYAVSWRYDAAIVAIPQLYPCAPLRVQAAKTHSATRGLETQMKVCVARLVE